MKKFKYISEDECFKTMELFELILAISNLTEVIFSKYKKLEEVELDSCYHYGVFSIKKDGIQLCEKKTNNLTIVIPFAKLKNFTKKAIAEIYWNFQGTYLNEGTGW